MTMEEEKKQENTEGQESKEKTTGQPAEKPTEPEKPHKKEIREHISSSERFARFYEKWHKLFAIIPLIVLALSLAFLGFKWMNGQELIKKDASLTGGITITVHYDQEISLSELANSLSAKFSDITVRKLSALGTGEQVGITLETSSEDIDSFKEEISSLLKVELTEENSSTEFTGPLLSKSFFKQLMWAFAIAFLFIAVVVLIIFRVFVPSFIAVFSIFSDAIITLTILSVFDFSLSSAGIAAFLMLIGYSIDTDILLTTRVLKRKEKEFYTRLWEAAQTGLTMTFVGIIAVLVSYFLLISPILKEIFLILTIGLFVDIMNTWLFNASVLRMYVRRHEKND